MKNAASSSGAGQWKTNNQAYGQHYNQTSGAAEDPAKNTLNSQSLRQKFATSTLDQLKNADPSGFVHQQENVAQRERHGLFTQPPGLSLGDQYHDKKRKPLLTQPRKFRRTWASTRTCRTTCSLSCFLDWVRPTSATPTRIPSGRSSSTTRRRTTSTRTARPFFLLKTARRCISEVIAVSTPNSNT